MKTISASKATPVLKQFAGLWTLEQQPSPAKEWSLEKKFKQVKETGFDAIGGGPLLEVVPLCRKYGLEYICFILGNADYAKSLEAANAVHPVRVNVQLGTHDMPPAEAVKLWIKMETFAAKMGLHLDLEVHRATCTETPEKVAEIATRYQKATGRPIRYCFDFSHLAVVKHLTPPYADRLLFRPDLVQLSRQTHLRPFNGHHCQIPATDGRGHETAEFLAYLEFVDAFISCWMKAAAPGDILYACPEFGPIASGYGISAFPNVWKDAILLRAKVEALWKANLRNWKRR